MILEIAYYGSPFLRKKTKNVERITEEVVKLVEDMIETMTAKDGIGIAAPQVHRNESIFITQVPILEKGRYRKGEIRVYLNPKILSYEQTTQVWEEGCLSIPGVYLDIRRPSRIVIEAMDLEGNIFQEELEGLSACNYLHENDHLNGVLHIDRAGKRDKEKIKPMLLKIKKKHNQ